MGKEIVKELVQNNVNSIKIEKELVTIKGPKGTLQEKINSKEISINLVESTLIVSRSNEEIEIKALHGLYRLSLIHI